MSLQQTVSPEIGDSAHDVELSIAHCDHGVLAEDDGFSSGSGNREFGEDDACHACLDDDSDDALQTHDYDGKRTLFCRRSEMFENRRESKEKNGGREVL